MAQDRAENIYGGVFIPVLPTRRNARLKKDSPLESSTRETLKFIDTPLSSKKKKRNSKSNANRLILLPKLFGVSPIPVLPHEDLVLHRELSRSPPRVGGCECD